MGAMTVPRLTIKGPKADAAALFLEVPAPPPKYLD